MTSQDASGLSGRDPRTMIIEALDEVDIRLSSSVIDGLAQQMILVRAYNEHTNVTAIREEQAFVWLHVVDSLLALPEVESAPPGLLVDIGSGAGYPGVPLLLAGGRQGLLVDSVSKKARLIALVVEALGIDATVSDDRVEDLARTDAAVVTARAVSSLPALLELSAPLLRFGGRLVALKGDLQGEELHRAVKVGEMVGLGFVGLRRYELPYERSARCAVVFERIGDPMLPLPRRVGLAQKEPLA